MKENIKSNMEAIDAIFTRRSVRRFENKQIPDEVLKKIINAGIYAPSALSLQPWGFIVVQDQAFLTRVSDYCKPFLISALKDAHDEVSDAFRKLLETRGFSIFYNAPTVILVIGRTDNRSLWIDCCLCAENMMLAAHASGIGSCWIGGSEAAFSNEEIMKGFQIPEGYSPIGTIVFGYPAEKPEVPYRKDPQIKWIR
ncbi:MAG: nitroreductase family protein [Methanosarcina sp.]